MGPGITGDLKPAVLCEKAAAKAFSMLGVINRNFVNLNREGFLVLYKTYTSGHTWSLQLRRGLHP